MENGPNMMITMMIYLLKMVISHHLIGQSWGWTPFSGSADPPYLSTLDQWIEDVKHCGKGAIWQLDILLIILWFWFQLKALAGLAGCLFRCPIKELGENPKLIGSKSDLGMSQFATPHSYDFNHSVQDEGMETVHDIRRRGRPQRDRVSWHSEIGR